MLQDAAAEAEEPAGGGEEAALAAAGSGKPPKAAAGTAAKKDLAASAAAEGPGGGETGVDQASAPASVRGSGRFKGQPVDAVRADALKALVARHAAENALPFELADAIVRLESRYNAGARNGANLGLTQVNVQTARSLGYKGDAAGLLDPETNLRFGLKYLAQAHRLAGGDTCGTVLRYQFGHRTQAMTKASRSYCAKVKTIAAAAQ